MVSHSCLLSTMILKPLCCSCHLSFRPSSLSSSLWLSLSLFCVCVSVVVVVVIGVGVVGVGWLLLGGIGEWVRG